MVSWDSHRKLGSLICGAYYPNIDKLIDTKHHDLSIYDAAEFVKRYKYVKLMYGEKGICYFILHHYIDRIVDVISSDLTYFAIQPPPDLCNKFSEHVYEITINDPKNVLTIILYDDLQQVLNLLYRYISSSKDRRKWEDRIKQNYELLHRNENIVIINEVRQQLQTILANIRKHWRKILYTVLTDKDLETTYRRSLNIYIQKIGSMAYRLQSTLRGKERLREFVKKHGEKFNELYFRLIQCYEDS